MVLQLSATAKARVAVAGLAALLLWPPVHYALVERYRLNPWRFFGFAMYCRPTMPVSTDVFLVDGDRKVPYATERWPVDGRRVLSRYGESRKVLGTLREPSSVAAWVFRSRPDVNEVFVIVRHPRIDRSTGLIAEEAFPYRYFRPGHEPGSETSSRSSRSSR